MINIEITQPEIEIEAHNLDCKIVSIKAEIAEEYYDDDKLELLIEYAMKLGEAYAQRDFNKKLEGCVVVPLEPTQKMLDAFPEVEYEDTYCGTCSIWVDDLTLTKGYKAMVEAARGGK